MSVSTQVELSKNAVITAWAEKLRFGGFSKWTRGLRGQGTRRDCMGVLVETMNELLGEGSRWAWLELDGRWGVCREADGRLVHSWGVIPVPLLAEVGLTTVDQCELQRLNDEGRSFRQIADYIERCYARV